MSPISKILIVSGISLVAAGLFWEFGGKHLPIGHSLGRLPGDIAVERPGVKFYFPLMSSIVLSVLLSVVIWLVNKFRS